MPTEALSIRKTSEKGLSEELRIGHAPIKPHLAKATGVQRRPVVPRRCIHNHGGPSVFRMAFGRHSLACRALLLCRQTRIAVNTVTLRSLIARTRCGSGRQRTDDRRVPPSYPNGYPAHGSPWGGENPDTPEAALADAKNDVTLLAGPVHGVHHAERAATLLLSPQRFAAHSNWTAGPMRPQVFSRGQPVVQ